MRTSIIGTVVAANLLNAAPTEGSSLALTQGKEGTVFSKELGDKAIAAIQGAWDIQEQVMSVSQAILDIAKTAVAEAKADTKLATAKFEACIAFAVVHFREDHGNAGAIEKAKIEDFLAGSWQSYTTSIGQALKDGFDILPYKSESALRAARKAMKDALRASRTLTAKVGDTLDLDGITEEQKSEAWESALRKAGGNSDAVTEGILENELRKLGFVEMEPAEETPEERETRVYNEAKEAASHFIGDDGRWAATRESVTKLLALLSKIPDDSGLEGKVKQSLDNAYVQIAKAANLNGGAQAQPHGKSEGGTRVQSL